MCTALILNRAVPGWPVVVAANRDEAYARDTGPPARVDNLRVSGVDRRAGGTWFGVTDGGFLCGITNHHVGRPPDPAKRSRGELVIGALRLGSINATIDWLRTLDGSEFNPFNLLFGDAAGGLRVAYGRVGVREIRVDEVPPGVHVLPNDVLDDPRTPRVAHALTLIGTPKEWPDVKDQLRAVLADHIAPICLHTEAYGTRSATLIALAPGRTEYWFAPGTLCTGDFQPWSW
jgi:uncharacterized protein with NRDE domain